MCGWGVKMQSFQQKPCNSIQQSLSLKRLKVYNRELLDKVRWIPETAALLRHTKRLLLGKLLYAESRQK
jgi:hypothetical protein